MSHLRPLAALGLATVTTAATLTATGAPAQAATRNERVHAAFVTAVHQRGDRYAHGADGPNRFDCSGLTYFAFHKRHGFKHFPRTSSAQARFARHIKRKNMRKGDLIFFTDGGGVHHVGLFAGWRHGRRTVLHSPEPGKRVRIDRLWTTHWFPGTLRHR